MIRHPWTYLAVSLILASSALVSGQTPPLPQFDVASVKENKLFEQPSNNWRLTPRGTDFHNSQLIELIKRAWGDAQLPNQAVEGGPDWIVRGRFDIVVQYPVGTDGATLNLMMRALLMDRFKLAAHFEPREVITYSMVLARADRRLGPRMSPSLASCKPSVGDKPAPGDGPECGPGDNRGVSQFGNVTMGNLAMLLSRRLGRRVANNTGLTDGYKIDLKYTPPEVLLSTPDPGAAARLTLEADAPDLFVAIQEQLGLKLEQVKSQGRVLIIDHIELPTAD